MQNSAGVRYDSASPRPPIMKAPAISAAGAFMTNRKCIVAYNAFILRKYSTI